MLLKNLPASFSQIRKIGRGRLFPAVLLGLSFSLSIYNYYLFRISPVPGLKILLIMAGLGWMGAVGYYFLLDRLIEPVFSEMKPFQRWLAVAVSIVFGIFLMAAGTNPLKLLAENIIFLAPDQTVKISAPADQRVQNPEIVLNYFFTSAGPVSYDGIDYQGWTREGSQLTLTDLADNSFQWSGKAGERAALVFIRSPQGGVVEVSWKNFTERVDLYQERNDKYTYNHYFSIPFYASREMVLLLAALNFIVVCFGISLFVWKERAKLVRAFEASMLPTASQMNASAETARQEKRKTLLQKWVVIAGLMLVALLLRVSFLGHPYLYNDEPVHLAAAKDVLSGHPLATVYQRSLYTVTLPVAMFTGLFGFNLWAAKLAGIIFNALAVIPLFLIVEKINRKAAILACILYATSPWIIAIAQIVREYAYYPFYFYWIAYGMIVFITRFPEGFVITKDWRKIIRPYLYVPALVLFLSFIYIIVLDRFSTAKVMLIAFGTLFLFLLAKFDLKNKTNILILGVLAGGCTIALLYYFATLDPGLSVSLGFQAFPLRPFFPNPQQQWYFERLALAFMAAFGVSIVMSVAFYRHNFVPLFLSTIFLVSIFAFLLFFGRHMRPRYVFSVQIWFIPLLGIGFYAIWTAIRSVLSGRALVASLVVLFLLLPLSVNAGQILAPNSYDKPRFMPVTDEYQHDMLPVETFLLEEARPGDIVVSTVYARYASWRGVPDVEIFHDEVYSAEELRQNLAVLMEQHKSGWIVLDTYRNSRTLPQAAFQIGYNTVEFVGAFGDQLVWRWDINN